MIKQYIIKDDLTLVDAKEVGIYKIFHQSLNQATQPTTDEDVVFYGLKELCDKLSVARQSIYNQINNGILIEGIHFFKPTGGKLLFKWSAMLEWVENNGDKLPKMITSTEHKRTTENPVPHNEQSHQSSVKTKHTPPTNKDYVNI